MEKIIGRKEEIITLNRLKNSKKSEFLAIYGRRRVGKTFLIRNIFDGLFNFQLTGVAKASTAQQLARFHTALVQQNPKDENKPLPKDWFEAFHWLSLYLASAESEKKIIFLDELPWLDTPQSNFVSALEHFWNSWASARTDIVLIVCGSAASWMINQLINNHGGLHNRVTQRIQLEPFTLSECEAFFQNRGGVLDRYQLNQLYMVMGGIPFYLEHVDMGLSAAQNIDKMCFSLNGVLRTEFDNLYASLFKKADKYIAVIEELAKKGKGMSRIELIAKAKLPNGGGTTKILQELEESNFIRKYKSFDKKERNNIYQLMDFYSLFYLKFIKESSLLDTDIWINSLDSPEFRAWSGYAFEQVCLAHIRNIKKALGISGVQTNTSAWLGKSGQQQAQIDLVIDRRDHVINLCEMKFSLNTFTIDKKYCDELRQKIGVFREQTGTKKALFLTMITSFGLTQNAYAASIVQNAFTMDVLFD